MTNDEPQPSSADLMREQRLQRNLKIVVGGLARAYTRRPRRRHGDACSVSRPGSRRAQYVADRNTVVASPVRHAVAGNPKGREDRIGLAFRQPAGRPPRGTRRSRDCNSRHRNRAACGRGKAGRGRAAKLTARCSRSASALDPLWLRRRACRGLLPATRCIATQSGLDRPRTLDYTSFAPAPFV